MKKKWLYSIRFRGQDFKTRAYSRKQAIFKIFVETYGVLKDPKMKRKAWNQLMREARVNSKM